MKDRDSYEPASVYGRRFHERMKEKDHQSRKKTIEFDRDKADALWVARLKEREERVNKIKTNELLNVIAQMEQADAALWGDAKAVLEVNILNHLSALRINFAKAFCTNEYGYAERDDRDTETIRFLKSTHLTEVASRFSIAKIRDYIQQTIDEHASKDNNFPAASMDQKQIGVNFELWVAEQLRKFGWTASVTSSSGDQGVDIIAKYNNASVGIQCKFQTRPVSNGAVQEVISGCIYYNLQHSVVISNQKYTRSAEELAAASNVILINQRDIVDLVKILAI